MYILSPSSDALPIILMPDKKQLKVFVANDLTDEAHLYAEYGVVRGLWLWRLRYMAPPGKNKKEERWKQKWG